VAKNKIEGMTKTVLDSLDEEGIGEAGRSQMAPVHHQS
jgi:hypothetical protein